ALLCVISVQAVSEMSYFSIIWASEKRRSLFRAKSVIRAPPTSLFKGTETPRRVTVVVSDFGGNERCNVGLLGGGGAAIRKPGTDGALMVSLLERGFTTVWSGSGELISWWAGG